MAPIAGMDYLKHGESAYPADAWVETQYMKEGANVSRTEIISYVQCRAK